MGKRILALDEKVLQEMEKAKGELSPEEFLSMLIDTYSEERERSKPILQKIDRVKGNLSRDGFLSSLIEDHTKEKKRSSSEELLTREEFLEFKGEIKGTLSEFVNSPDFLFESLEREEPESSTPLEGKGAFGLRDWLLWIPAALLFGFGDAFTSSLCLSKGIGDLNPLLSLFQTAFGGNILPLILLKVFCLGLLAFISFKWTNQKWMIPFFLTILGGVLIIWNSWLAITG